MRTAKDNQEPGDLTGKEAEEIYTALSIRCGFIETNTIHRAKELEKAGQKSQIRVLDVEQMRKIVELEDLMARMLKIISKARNQESRGIKKLK